MIEESVAGGGHAGGDMSERTDLDRLDELGSRQAFQDDAIATLNEALVLQQQRIARLEKMLDLVVDRFREAVPDLVLPEEEPPPPHY
jgi:SlyX protein